VNSSGLTPYSTLLAAFMLAYDRGGETEAESVTGIDLEEARGMAGLQEQLDRLAARGAKPAAPAPAVPARRTPRRGGARRSSDPSSLLVDREAVVRGAGGRSVLRLPWLEETLFVGRQLPDMRELPREIQHLCLESYRAGIAGEPSRFTFSSYGYSYEVDAAPVRRGRRRVRAVLGVAHPLRPQVGRLRRAAELEGLADRLREAAALEEHDAELYRLVGQGEAQAAASEAAEGCMRAARRVRALALRQRSDCPGHAD
jgi:hypothetical protein